MIQRFSCLVALVCLVACTHDAPADATSELDSRIERIENGLVPNLQIKGEPLPTFNVDERLEELNIPGLSIAFAVDGEVEWARGYGMADRGEDRAMTPDTLLLAGSISKPVAAVRALQLAKQGVFDLDKNINDYLKSWQVPDNEYTESQKVTLRRILNHTAGLTVWGFPGYDKGDDIPSVVDVLDGKGNTDPVRVFRTPGEAWQYSGGGYTIMQLAVSDIEDMPFEDSLQTNVLDRMGMAGSTFRNPLPDSMHGMAATGYRTNGDEVEGKWPIYPEMAAAGLWTTPSQLVQYGIEMQRILLTGEDGILAYDTVAEMLDAEADTHGLGPSVHEYTFGHGGADEGFRAQLYAWKETPYAVAVIVNSDNSQIIKEVLLSVAMEYGLPGIEPSVREVVDVKPADLERLVGSYDLENTGVFDVVAGDNRLEISRDEVDYNSTFLPQSGTEFFDSESGVIIRFEIENGSSSGFEVRGRRAVRVD